MPASRRPSRAWRTARRLSATSLLLLAASVLLLPLPGVTSLRAQAVPSPAEHFGFEMGADRRLADWAELVEYYRVVADRSPRVSLDTLGPTTRGRPFVLLTVTSEENHARLDDLRRTQMKLSDPRSVSGPEELEDLLERGRAVVLLTHAIHSTEVGSFQMAPRLVHRLATSEEPDVRRILDEVVVLDIPSLNPDGTQWVTDWYERWRGTAYEAAPLPWLYHSYVGHDNNRDWYAFTQVETRHAVTGAHNRWHPHIVHDIHQMGGSGARIFFPPYLDPWEPNVDPALTAAVNGLGTWIAARLHAEGKRGVVVNAIYDAYSPARAYQHYHAGARILSETASARMASPDTVAFSELRGRRGYDPRERSWNFPRPWRGGAWHLSDIVDYMDAGAMALLDHAARNRRYWLENAYRINERAVEGWEEWPAAWAIRGEESDSTGLAYVLRILRLGDVEVRRARQAFEAAGRSFPAGTFVVPMRQPYAGFAQTLLEVQRYPEALEYPGGPPRRPYDATAHTLPLLMDVRATPLEEMPGTELDGPIPVPDHEFRLPEALRGDSTPRIALYKSWGEPMESGWTRWLFDQHGLAYDTLHAADVRAGGLSERYDALLLQSQDPAELLNGWSADRMPPEGSGGLGEEGSRALRDFVRGGGRIVAVEEATDFVVDLFGLGVSNAVERLPDRDFYVPGSILRLVLEPDDPLSGGLDADVAAWYGEASRAFNVTDPALRVAARYGEGNPLLSGWILGPEHLAGRPALVEAEVGRGSVVLFGFQPNYRGQSVATWPLLFEALIPTTPGETAGGDP